MKNKYLPALLALSFVICVPALAEPEGDAELQSTAAGAVNQEAGAQADENNSENNIENDAEEEIENQEEQDVPTIGEGAQAWSDNRYSEAMSIFQTNADNGDASAMTVLGYMYTSGTGGVERDFERGLGWYRASAEKDEPYAMYALSVFLTEHPELETKRGESREMLQAAVDKKLPLACKEYYEILLAEKKDEQAKKFLEDCITDEQIWAITAQGVQLCNPDNPEYDEKAGLELLNVAFEKGDPSAAHFIGLIELQNKRYEDGNRMLESAANQNYAPAMYELGRLALIDGDGKSAIDWLTKAVEENYPRAYGLLGNASESGVGLEKNLSAAADYYKKAAEAGDAVGCNEYGRVLEKGIGVEQSPEQAYLSYENGAKLGCTTALYNQARAEIYGIGVKAQPAKGVGKLRLAVDLNEPNAKTALAILYSEGKHVRKNENEAQRLFKEAAEQGEVRAQCVLAGKLLTEGDETDCAEAIKLYQNAAEQGYAYAQYSLARCYVERDSDLLTASKWYSAAANQDYPAALCAMGIFHLLSAADKEEKFDELNSALEMIERSAQAGYMPAEFALGSLNELGTVAERDIQAAMNHYRIAAEGGNLPAQLRLASAYSLGELGLDVDKKEAFKWYLAAAEKGEALAQCNAAACYAGGIGVAKNESAAYKWYKLSAENGNVQAQYNYGLMTLLGIGTWRASKEGLEWLKKAAAADYHPAQNELGTLYSVGREVPRNFETARYWLELAADAGYAPAQFNLGLLYIYTPEEEGGDPAAAVVRFEQATLQGHALAAWYLGNSYEEGRGVEQDLEKAAEYYRMSGDVGDERAEKALARVAEKQEGLRKQEVQQ